MVTSIHRGGLGNILFQVATGYTLAKTNNTEYSVNPSLHYERGQGHHISQYENTILKNIPKTDKVPTNIYKEKDFHHHEIPQIAGDLLLDGYFQTEKYFENSREEINNLFGFDSYNSIPNTCGIQIRLGDYLHLSDFTVINPDYIKHAVDFIREMCPSVEFVIVTDDENRAKDYIPEGVNYKFVGDMTHSASDAEHTVESLRILSMCEYCIISNSSFGWWGSYLGKKKPTLAPFKWFNTSHNTSDVYRDDMIKIQF